MSMNAAEGSEDKLLLSKAYDALELSERWGSPRFLGFLNEHESDFLRANISSKRDFGFYGGYPDAQRLMLGAGAADEDYPITALEFRYKPEYELGHRDFLGALMALGIKRETVGDILTSKGRTVIFFTDEIAPYILSNVDRIGRTGVKVGYADTSELPQGDTARELSISLSSLRLDAFVAAVCGLSREKAARLIKADMVAVDHVINNSVAHILSEGSVVTVRKYGKYILNEILGYSRKGKLRLSVKHFG